MINTRYRCWILLSGLGVALLLWASWAYAAVTLTYFEASITNNGILLSWETGSEINNIGFNLYRATNPADQGEYIDFIPSMGAIAGASYEYLDTNVTPGVTYYYTLESLDADGTSEFHGPVEITYQPSQPATQTPTPTPTLTPTPIPTATPTPTSTPTPTPTTAQPTPTPTPSPTATATPTPTPTITPTSTPTATPTITPTPSTPSPNPSSPPILRIFFPLIGR